MREVIVYVDYENLRHSPFYAFGYEARDLNPLRLGELLVSRRNEPSKLAQVRIYRGRPSFDHERDRAERQIAWENRVRSDSRCELITRPLHYTSNRRNRPGREKGIDVSLAIDFTLHTIRTPNLAAILVTRDADLLPALEAFQELRSDETPFELASCDGLNRLQLGAKDWPWCHFLTQADFELIRED